jgi:hypothetical protein
MVYEENSDNDNGDPTINPTSKAPSSASEANTSKLLGPDDKIAGADPVDNIEIDVTATANARKRRTIKHRKLSKTKQRLLWRRSKVAEYTDKLSCYYNLIYRLYKLSKSMQWKQTVTRKQTG